MWKKALNEQRTRQKIIFYIEIRSRTLPYLLRVQAVPNDIDHDVTLAISTERNVQESTKIEGDRRKKKKRLKN